MAARTIGKHEFEKVKSSIAVVGQGSQPYDNLPRRLEDFTYSMNLIVSFPNISWIDGDRVDPPPTTVRTLHSHSAEERGEVLRNSQEAIVDLYYLAW